VQLVLLVIGLLLVVTATVLVRPDLAQIVLHGTRPKVDAESTTSASSHNARQPTGIVESGKTEPSRLTFDVVRIGPGGVSVFAGRAPANSKVTVLANGHAVAITQADPTGAWATVTEKEFAPGDYELSLNAMLPRHGDNPTSPPMRVTVAPSRLLPPRGAASFEATLMSPSVPTPITFLYNESTLTTQGRKAVAVLAQYLIAQRSETALLSGHADERGTDLYNMRLSRDRLEVVAEYLRRQGFSGQLELQAKGRSEPFAGADRRSLSREQVFQLDRRVELRAAN
jgi:outer membrane protein OmpA-like peptidoglycan-associated protein